MVEPTPWAEMPPSGDESAERAINATSFGRDVMASHHVPTVLVCIEPSPTSEADTIEEFGLGCEYNRERKKRGKASRKDLQQQQAAAAAAAANGESVSPNPLQAQSRSPTGSSQTFNASPESTPVQDLPAQGLPYSRSMSVGGPYATSGLMGHLSTITRSGSVGNLYDVSNNLEPPMPFSSRTRTSPLSAPPEMRLNVFEESDEYARQTFPNESDDHVVPSVQPQGQFHGSFSMSSVSQPYASHEYTMISPHTQDNQNSNPYGHAVSGDMPDTGFVASVTPMVAPTWTPQISSSLSSGHPPMLKSAGADLRYPVLAPLLPYIDSILSTSVACELLEAYFATASTSYVQPTSPNALTSIFRTSSVLARSQPRTTSPTLLASMLWVAAQTSEASVLTESASARANVCQKLLEVTLDLLNPLNHGLAQHESTNSSVRGLGLGPLGDPKLGSLASIAEDPATLDDVVTYLHLATVLSNTGHGLVSSRWWTAAFTIAKELKLNVEVASHGSTDVTGEDAEGEEDVDFAESEKATSEEAKEERRRVWWLLFAMDRHIAFTYSHSTFLAGSDCTQLFQALDDETWQSTGATSSTLAFRKKGPSTECTGRSLLGYYLPLMVILGDIIDLKNARSHPRFAANSSASQYHLNCSSFISRQLEAYNQSLRRVESRYAADAETLDFAAHAKFTMHALHVLLVGKWDPSQLLADTDKWSSTEAFSNSLSHAIAAAEALSCLLDRNMRPFITGPFLLQTSWLLMLAADKFREGASTTVINALNTCVRAIEKSTGLLRPDQQVRLFSDYFHDQHKLITISGISRPTDSICSRYRLRPADDLENGHTSSTGVAPSISMVRRGLWPRHLIFLSWSCRNALILNNDHQKRRKQNKRYKQDLSTTTRPCTI